jgi:cell division GTPase FtsZ
MLNRRYFFKRLFSGGVFLSSTSLNPFLKTLNSPLALAERKGDLSAPKIRVIGLGGCGNQAIDHMVLSTPNRDNFILADRDFGSENSTSIRQLIILETDLSEMGARAIDDPAIAFKKDQQNILQALQGSDMVLIVAGLGGRTGTFWAPVIAEICNKLDILTVAVITKPLIKDQVNHEDGLKRVWKN